ncbi:MAG: hypothetical protein AB8I08_33175 [Sandaracinaceae bacterium]
MARRFVLGLILWSAALLGGCPETVRCDDGEVFDEDGECGPIPDAGDSRDAGPPDSGS